MEAVIDKKTNAGRWRRRLRAAVVTFWCMGAACAWAQGGEAGVAVESFDVVGNTLLPAAEIEAALAPYRGRRTLEELKQAAAAVQELYRTAGYGAVIAYVPEQAPAGGRITIAVLEGKVANVVVTGNQQFSTAVIRRSLPALQEGKTPPVRQLDMQVQLANENPARQTAVTLEPGAAPGEVDARVVVSERNVSRGWVYVDNTGDEQTGDWRATLGWRHDNVAGLDHQASLQVQISPTSIEDVLIATATYSVPLYVSGLRLDTYAAYSNVESGTTATAAGSLRFSGKGDVLGARLTKLLPRWGEADHRIGVGLDRRDYLNECTIAGLPPGACGPAGESVTANPLTLEYLLQAGGPTTGGAYAALSNNLDLGGRFGDPADFEAVRPGAPLHYTIWRFGAYANPTLGAGWSLRVRALAQVSGDALVPGEQFGLAGVKSVRGYYEREVVGDEGYAGSVEVVSPELLNETLRASAGSVRVSLFGDGGEARNHLGTECRQGQSRCTLYGYGVGLGWLRGPGQLRLDLARAGRDGTISDKGDWRLHVAASWSIE